MIPTFLIKNDELFQEIVKLTHETPNDAELGSAVRNLIIKNNRLNTLWASISKSGESDKVK